MVNQRILRPIALLLSLCASVFAQEDGYIGYNLEQRGDAESAIYETANTESGVPMLSQDPDVYLNASVHVGEIDIEVDNITAKVNVDAQVLKLLHFTAGVDASIDRVKLTIQNVSAEVELEARLGNVVEMVNAVLHSIDLNPIVATLGQDINKIVNNTVGVISQPGFPDSNSNGGSTTSKRDLAGQNGPLEYNVINNVLYSVNDYSGQTHTNRILAQNGTIYDVHLDNDGNEHGRTNVGYYSRDMSFNGHNKTISINGEVKEYEMEYIYAPFPGLEAVALIYMNVNGAIDRTRIIAEATAGGTSTISDDDL